MMGLCWQLTAWADVFVVNRLIDGVDVNPGDGLCEVTQGLSDCSLRAALNEANALGGSHDVNLGVGVHLISLLGIDDDGLLGDLDVFAATVTITGLSPDLSIIDGNFTGRVMQVINGADLTLNNLTIRNGYANDAGEYAGGGLNADMRTTGHTQVNLGNVHFINNTANIGGGVYLLANVSMHAYNVMFKGNGLEDFGFSNFYGAALYCRFCDDLVLDSVSITEHTGALSVVGISRGDQFGIINTTISDNEGYGLFTEDGNGQVRFSSFSENANGNYIATSFDGTDVVTFRANVMSSVFADDCAQFLPVSEDYNITSDDSCALTLPGDLENTDPLLLPLASSATVMPHHLPSEISPAVDHVVDIYCSGLAASGPLMEDQRATPRPQYARCDAGAVDLSESEGIIFVDGFDD